MCGSARKDIVVRAGGAYLRVVGRMEVTLACLGAGTLRLLGDAPVGRSRAGDVARALGHCPYSVQWR